MLRISVKPDPANDRPQHLSLIRPGEIVVLLRPKYPAQVPDSADLDATTQQAIADLFQAIGSPLSKQPSELGQARRYARPPLTVRRAAGDSVRVLHTVNLSTWFDANVKLAADDEPTVYNAVMDVSKAMLGLRQRFAENHGQPLDAGNYVIEAATPNWLAGLLQSW